MNILAALILTGCEIIGFNTQMPATYTWLLALQGSERIGAEIQLEPGTRLTCETLGIEPEDLHTARWIYVVRKEFGKDPQFLRGRPTGLVCSLDINGDGFINAHELGQVKTQFFMRCHEYLCSADFSGDGVVNTIDVGMLKQNYFKECVGTPAT